MDEDDVLKGRLLSRREVLGLMGAAGLALIVGCDDGGETPAATSSAVQPETTVGSPATQATAAATTSVPSCIVRPVLTEGPYFVDVQLARADIRTNASDGAVRDGTPLTLALVVSQVGNDGSCAPLAGANVDVWHCDALGVYSGVQDPMFDTSGENWLRGYQVTDADGRVEFTTIYPGWYPGRATHIHFKTRTDPDADVGTEFTSQFFFDDALSDQVHAQGAYAEKGASGRLQNSGDAIYGQSGDQLTLDVQPQGDGYAATFEIGIQLDGA
jgi:protocatechuate 3,4-dioxygenase beta subunit